MQPASRWKLSSRSWPTGPRKTVMPCFVSSTAISAGRKVQREALLRIAPPSRCIGHSLGSGWSVPCPGGSGAVPLAQAETLLRDLFRNPQAKTSDRVFHDRPPVLHAQGYVEAELVSARLRLRPRVARKK